MIKNYKSSVAKFLILIAIIGVSIVLPKNTAHASNASVTGWAWSSTIGWISLKSTNPGAGTGAAYGVTVNTNTGATSGYAWSPNIGWISFNPADVSGCGVSQCAAKVDMSFGKISGWIRVVSGIGRTDGWDGWIELSGNNHKSPVYNSTGGVTLATSTGAITGYAWGGNVIGWVYFNAMCSGCATTPNTSPTVTLTANPSSISYNAGSMLTWNAQYSNSCTASNGWSGSKDSTPGDHTELQSGLIADTTYRITCTNGIVGVWAEATVTVAPSGVLPTVSLIADPIVVPSGGSSSLIWTSNNATSCTASGDWSGSKSVAAIHPSEAQTNITTSKTYTLTCYNALGQASAPATVVITIKSTGPTYVPLTPPLVSQPEIKLFIGNNATLATKDINTNVILDQADVPTYRVKKNETFSLKWVNNGVSMSDYECTAIVRRQDGLNAAGIWQPWDDNTDISGLLSNLSPSGADFTTYSFYRKCYDNDSTNGIGVNKDSNVVKLQIINSNIEEI